MAHNTSKLAKTFDFINREGFEWLMHPLNNYRRYQAKYPGNFAGLRYSTRLFFTALFTIIPVIPALYVLSRTATVFSEPFANPLKTFLMTAVAGGIAAGVYFVGFGALSTMTAMAMPSLVGYVATALTVVGLSFPPVALAIVASGIVVGAGLAIAGALGFYGAKSAAQAINSWRFNGLTSTSKHQLPMSMNADDNLAAVKAIYDDVLLKQKVLKEMAVTVPAEDKKVIAQFLNDTDVPFGKVLNTTLEEGKQLLAGLESIVAESHQETLEWDAYDPVLGNGLFHSYVAKVGLINGQKFGNPDGDRADLNMNVSQGHLATIHHNGEQRKISSGRFL